MPRFSRGARVRFVDEKPQGVLEQLLTFFRGLNAAKSLTDTALSSRTG